MKPFEAVVYVYSCHIPYRTFPLLHCQTARGATFSWGVFPVQHNMKITIQANHTTSDIRQPALFHHTSDSGSTEPQQNPLIASWLLLLGIKVLVTYLHDGRLEEVTVLSKHRTSQTHLSCTYLRPRENPEFFVFLLRRLRYIHHPTSIRF